MDEWEDMRWWGLLLVEQEDDEGCPRNGDGPTDKPIGGFLVFVADVIAERKHGENSSEEFPDVECFFRNAPLIMYGSLFVYV